MFFNEEYMPTEVPEKEIDVFRDFEESDTPYTITLKNGRLLAVEEKLKPEIPENINDPRNILKNVQNTEEIFENSEDVPFIITYEDKKLLDELNKTKITGQPSESKDTVQEELDSLYDSRNRNSIKLLKEKYSKGEYVFNNVEDVESKMTKDKLLRFIGNGIKLVIGTLVITGALAIFITGIPLIIGLLSEKKSKKMKIIENPKHINSKITNINSYSKK